MTPSGSPGGASRRMYATPSTITGVWKALSTGRRSTCRPRRAAEAVTASVASRSPATTTWNGLLTSATHTPGPASSISACASSRPHPKIAIAPGGARLKREEPERPVKAARRIAVVKSVAPAAKNALCSPWLWPQTTSGRTPSRASCSVHSIEFSRIAG